MTEGGDILALKHGWKVGFGDDDEFVDYFFANHDSETTRMVWRNDDGEIVAQMHYYVFCDDVCGEKGCYIYGVTTLPQYRGRGYARMMIEKVLALLATQDVGYVVLIAQEEGLRRWYEGLGFKLADYIINVRGKKDNMNFAMDDCLLNQGMYHILKPGIKEFSKEIMI